MLVHISFRGRIGNNLFQYAIGRLIANHHDCQIEVSTLTENMELSTKFDPDMLPSVAKDFPSLQLKPFRRPRPGRVDPYIWEPSEACIWESRGWDGQSLPLDDILSDTTDRTIWLGGFFQRYEYYRGNEDFLRSLFTPRTTVDLPHVSEADALIIIRGGQDFEERGWCISPQFYSDALEMMDPCGRVYICGTGITDCHLEYFSRYKPIYFSGTMMDDMNFIMRFRKIALANSTFAWWSAFLSEAEIIIAPVAPQSPFYSFEGNGVDLNMCHPRYRTLQCEFGCVPAFSACSHPSVKEPKMAGEDWRVRQSQAGCLDTRAP